MESVREGLELKNAETKSAVVNGKVVEVLVDEP